MVLKATVILGLLLAICVKLGAHPVYYMDQGLTAKSSRLEKLEKLVYHELHAFQSRVNSLDLTLSVSLECEACRFGAELIHILFTQNITEKEVVYLVSEVCNVAKIESTRVCQAVALEFKDEFFYVADNLVLTPDEICGTLIGTSCGHPYNPTTFWNITLPATPKPPIIPPKPPKKGAPISRVLHLADIHYDRDYMTGSNTECGEPLCCRSNDGPPAPSKPGAGKYGDYNNCDAPRSLIENAFQHLSKNEKFDYIIMTGDLPAHNIWNQSRSDQLEVLKEITDMLLKYFPGVKVYPAVGNHESSPVNSFPPPSISNKDLSISWLYNAFAYQWVNRTGWLPSDTVADIKNGAYYTVLIHPGFRLISLNMNMCNNGNFWLLLNTTDPGGELKWLINVLQNAENNDEKVHIIGHINPGNGGCLRAWSWNYYKIVNRYESTIVAQFFGHTHYDSFELFYDEKTLKRPTNIAYIGGSITTYSFLNPNYRLYDIDGNYNSSSRVVLDHSTYVMNLTDANLTGNTTWFKEYSAKSAFNMTSLLPADWQKVVDTFKKNDTLFQEFYRYYNKLHVTSSCDDACKKSMICDLQTARSSDPSLCKDDFFGDVTKLRKQQALC